MRPSEPPALATWLLERLVPGKKNEALAGDLLEEFERRRSVTWYWRQVFGAIVAGFSKELHARWSTTEHEIVWTFGFATVWTCVVPAYQDLIFRSSLLQFFGDWMSRQPKPEWSIYEHAVDVSASTVIVASGVALYLTIMRRFDVGRFFGGAVVGLSVAVICNTVAPLFVEAHLLFVSRLVWRFGWELYYGIQWLPLSLAVQFSIWATRSHWMQSKNPIEI